MVHALRLKRPGGTWPAYAAAIWAVAFGCLSFYWALGGQLGLGTLASVIRRKALARDDGFIFVVWVTGAFKVVLALLPLALVRQWRVGVPRRWLQAGALFCGVALALYGAMGVVNGAVSQLGVFHPEDASGARWYLFLWGPVWLTGGLLLLASVWRSHELRIEHWGESG